MLPMEAQSNYVQEVARRLGEVRRSIDAAAQRAGRSPAEVELVAVTKTHPPETVRALWEAGHEVMGENRVQEALKKMESLPGRGHWHLIGHLQRNKVKAVVGRFALIHSVDSVRLIAELERRASEAGLIQSILLEFNVSGEPNKTGAAPEDLPSMLEALRSSPHLEAEGFMTMAPYSGDPENSRPYFIRLRELLETVPSDSPLAARRLSMGMSADFEVGVEEGATLVRVGTAIFGPRKS